ncbi:MAG: hypothetical protein ACTHOE_14085 [Conexibacter sp.]
MHQVAIDRRPVRRCPHRALLLATLLALLALGAAGLRSGSAAAAVVRPFAPNGVWNAPLPAVTPLDPRSAQLVGAIGREIVREQLAGSSPWINTRWSTTTVYVVPATQPLMPVQLVNHAPDAALQQAWSAVPVPPDATPSPGSDHEITVWQPSTDRLWEFWHFERAADGGFQAQWGGAMSRVHANPGYFSSNAWPGARPWWGATATSLPLLGGLIRAAELRQGHIDHALALALPGTRARLFRWPAQRTDGRSTDLTSIPEGARLRLDPTLDVAALHLPPVTEAIALAAQRYGILVRDTAPNIAFYAEAPTAADPYLGADGLFGGSRADQLLARFPWSRLQVVRYGS